MNFNFTENFTESESAMATLALYYFAVVFQIYNSIGLIGLGVLILFAVDVFTENELKNPDRG